MTAKIIQYLKPYRLGFAVAVGQVWLISACELLKPWPIKLVIDNVLSGKPIEWPWLSHLSLRALLGLIVAGLVLIYVVLAVLNVLHYRTTISIGQQMVNDLRTRLYDHIQRLSLAFHSRRGVGDLIYRVTSDTYSIQTLAMNGFFPILTASVLLIGMFVIMFRIDPLLSWISVGICPFLAAGVKLIGGRITESAGAARERESGMFNLVQRAISSIRVIRAFSMEEQEQRKFSLASSDSLRASLRLYTWQAIYTGAVTVTVALGTAAVIWVGANHALSGRITVGELVVFLSYLASLYTPINSISQTIGLIHEAKVGARRVFEILDTQNDIKDGKLAFLHEDVRGAVEFRDVVFEYEPKRPVLRGINLSVKPGQLVAIVGPTGGGKSTLVSLIPRFYEAAKGQVLIDGVDVRELKLSSLRACVSMVLQPPIVFPISIRENIAYGNPGASNAKVVEAAESAQIHEMIMRLPFGYETVVGEQGATLSEGERQRLTIARAILRKAPILILDEPTSSVDTKTEHLIMESLRGLIKGRTTFVIAHRLSTVQNADLILVLSDGRIIERGSFSELLDMKGEFFALHGASKPQPAEEQSVEPALSA